AVPEESSRCGRSRLDPHQQEMPALALDGRAGGEDRHASVVGGPCPFILPEQDKSGGVRVPTRPALQGARCVETQTGIRREGGKEGGIPGQAGAGRREEFLQAGGLGERGVEGVLEEGGPTDRDDAEQQNGSSEVLAAKRVTDEDRTGNRGGGEHEQQ